MEKWKDLVNIGLDMGNWQKAEKKLLELREDIMHCIYWGGTPQGADFWYEVYSNLGALAKLVAERGREEEQPKTQSDLKMQIELDGKKYKLVEME